MTDIKDLPIAVIDSGVGGISVLRELIKIMPCENYLYLGDSKNAPYGKRTREDVLDITRRNLDYLKKLGIKALVIACNTATAAAANALREENPDLVIVGIEPAIKPAATSLPSPRIIVMATPLTLSQDKYLSLAHRFSDTSEIIPLPCPGLVELIEGGKLDSPEIDEYLNSLLSPYKDENIDAVVLGCTHYPHVRAAIARQLSQKTLILDGGEGTARQTRRRLGELSLLRDSSERGLVEIKNSTGDPRLIELSQYLLYRE